MKFKPLHDWVVIHQETSQEKSQGGIYIPESAQEKSQAGKVISVGEGKFEEPEDKKRKTKGSEKEKKFVKTVLKPGQTVFYEKYGTTPLEFEGKEYILVREKDVLGWLE